MDARLSAHSHEALPGSHAAQVRTYWIIFGCLAALTLLTVGVAYLHLPHEAAVVVAIAIAITKVSLIAAFFMHMKGEAGVILATMATAVALIVWLLIAVLPDIGLLG
ncbi:MAG TPA: cytochrome C oxidase subunit IV family protein [Candidatus Bathyarchaeia archaeon]|nr:cytochrome C oxidase subunit IV family protein [Candidatus Bathyarchaeia archaeon]